MQVPGDSCIRNSVCLLARVQSAQGDILDEVRYTNCFQGHTSINQHAEEFLITDDRLNLQPKAHLTLYVTYQPCHYSGGGRKMRTHPRSCTNRLISWYETKLAPLKITLTIKPCDIYRAHWTDPALFAHPADWLTFGKRTQSALAGVQKLLSFLKAMTPADWTYLLSHSTVDQIPIKAMEKRLFFDDKVQTWLTSIQFRSSFAT